MPPTRGVECGKGYASRRSRLKGAIGIRHRSLDALAWERLRLASGLQTEPWFLTELPAFVRL